MKLRTRTLSLLTAVAVMATPAMVSLTTARLVAQEQKPEQKPAPKPVDVTGKWVLSLALPIGNATPGLVLKQDGEKLTGTYVGRYGEFALAGTRKGAAINFAFEMTAEGQTVPVTFTGEVAPDGQSMKGTGEMGGMGEMTWTATRDK